jgi:serine/threonine protein kinase
MSRLRDKQDAFRFVEWDKTRIDDRNCWMDVFYGVYRPLGNPPIDVTLRRFPRSPTFLDDLDWFFDVVEMMASLSHPACMPLLACSFDPHDPLSYVIPRTDVPLSDVLEQVRKYPVPDFWNDTVKSIIALGVASGLAYLHSRGILCKGLFARHIFLDSQFRPLLCSVALSQYAGGPDSGYDDDETWNRIAFRSVADEPCFWKDENEMYEVYQYGRILYELFTGRRTSRNKSRLRQAFKDVPGQDETPSHMNPDCWELIKACLTGPLQDCPSFREILDQSDVLMLESCDRDAFARYKNTLPIV